MESRLEFLRQTQNPDGGWGYFPGKQSWFEPTAYAMLALHGAPETEKPLGLAWNLIRSWQCHDGSFRPCARVPDGTWVTAHAVTLACIRGVYDDSTRRAVNWILAVVGAEHDFATFQLAYIAAEMGGHRHLVPNTANVRDGMRRPAPTGCDKLPVTHSRCKGDGHEEA